MGHIKKQTERIENQLANTMAPNLFATLSLIFLLAHVGWVGCWAVESEESIPTSQFSTSRNRSRKFHYTYSIQEPSRKSSNVEVVDEAEVNCGSLSCNECAQMDCSDQCSCSCRARCQNLQVCSNCQSGCQTSGCALQSGCETGCALQSGCTQNSCRKSSCSQSSCSKKCTQRNCSERKEVQQVSQSPVRIEYIPGESTNTQVPSESVQHNDQSSNLTATLDITNQVNTTNEVHIPIVVNSTNLNTVHVTGGSIQAPPINITIGTSNTHTGGNQSSPCCMQMGPQMCKYNEDKQLNCTQAVQQKVCGPQCSSPLIYQRPLPGQTVTQVVERKVQVPVPMPYPVPQIQKVFVPQKVEVVKHIPQPYPVTKIQHVAVPQPVPVPQPYPVTKIQQVPVHIRQPVAVPVPQPYPVNKVERIPVIVPQPVPVPQPYPVTRVQQVPVPQPYPVPQVHHVPIPQIYPINQIQQVQQAQPVVIQQPQPMIVQQPQLVVQQPTVSAAACPITYWQGASYPTCPSIQASGHLMGSQQQFLVDGFVKQSMLQQSICSSNPWMPCTNGLLTGSSQDCSNCLFCNGQYAPEVCINSAACSATCRQVILSSQAHKNFGKFLNCSTNQAGSLVCK